MKTLLLLVCCLFLGCLGGKTGSGPGGAVPVASVPAVESVPGIGSEAVPVTAAAAGPTEGVAPVEDSAHIEEI